MHLRPDSFRLQSIVFASLLAAASISTALPARARAQACDIPLTSAFEHVANPGCYGGPVLVGDWNGDGRPDLVTGTCFGSNSSLIHTFMGSPNGIVPGPDVPSPSTPIGQYPRAIDLNMDGKLDLIVGGTPPVVWYGHGDGTFDAPIPVPGLPAGLNWIWTVDLNGDHRLDLVSLVANPDVPYGLWDTVRTFLANGSDGFTEGPALTLPGENSQQFIRAEDLNGDGRGDLVVAVAYQEELRTDALIYFGDGTGGFQPPTTLHTSTDHPFDGLVDVLDWNGDGKLDIALSAYTRLDLFFGHGDGTFSTPVTTDDALLQNSGPPFTTFGDVNGDATPDLVESDGSGGFRVLVGSLDGHLGAPRSYSNLPSGYPTVVQAVGDPAPDLVAPAGAELVIYENLAGAFEKLPSTNLPRRSENIRVADLNGDGRTDLVVHLDRSSSSDPDSVLVELVTPALGLNLLQVLTMAPLPGPSWSYFQDFRLSDITGDGIPELLVLRYAGAQGMISVFRGLPGGTFGSRFDRSFETPSGERPFSMLVGDLNKDGFRDLLITRFVVDSNIYPADQMSGVAIAVSQGDGTVDDPVDVFRTFGLLSSVLRDVNADGSPDLLAYEPPAPYFKTFDRALTVRLANGDGTFGAPTTLPVLPTSSTAIASLRVGDVNGDGQVDAVILRTVGDVMADRFRAHVFLGHADGTFSGPVTSTADSLISSVFFLGDLNADGRADLIVADGALLRLFCGRPDGTFVAGSRVGTTGGSALFQTDMDGDGGVDIAVVGRRITYHRNLLVSLAPLVATMTLDPPVIQPRSRAPWVHVTLELGAGHQVSEIDPGSLRILGVAPVEKSARIGDADSDGIADLTLAFPREPFNQLAPGEHEAILTGQLVGGTAIEAKATIRVLETQGKMALREVSPLGASPVVLEISNSVDARRTVRVFDVKGRMIRAWEERNAIGPRVTWDGRTASGANAPSGIYFTRVSTLSGEATARTVLLR